MLNQSHTVQYLTNVKAMLDGSQPIDVPGSVMALDYLIDEAAKAEEHIPIDDLEAYAATLRKE